MSRVVPREKPGYENKVNVFLQSQYLGTGRAGLPNRWSCGSDVNGSHDL
jgi:hypothetical protein